MEDFLFEKTPLYFMIQSLSKDEGLSYLFAKQKLSSLLTLTEKNFYPPFYYFLLHFWMKIFGKGEVSLRSLSLFFFAITIYFIFLFLQNIFKIKEGKNIFIYLLLFSLNPFLLYYAFEVGIYSLFALLSTLSFYYFLKKEKTKYLIFTLLGLYTHWFFILIVLTQISYLLFFEKKLKPARIKVSLIALLFFLPWVLYSFLIFGEEGLLFWSVKPKMADFFSSLGMLFTGYERSDRFYNLPILLVSLFFFFLIILLIANKPKKTHFLSLLLLWAFLGYFLIFFISFIKPFFSLRYLIFSGVGFNLLIFYLLETIKKGRWIILSIIFLIILNYTGLEVTSKRKPNIRKTISEIKKLAKKNDYLFVSNKNLDSYFVALYYFDEERVYLYKETAEPLPPYLNHFLLSQDKITTKLPPYPQKAFILDNDYQYRIQMAL